MKKEKEEYYLNKLLESLLRHDIVTNGMMSEEVGIAERSVRTKLGNIEAFLTKENLGTIERKPHVGIWLQANERQRAKLMQMISQTTVEQDYIPTTDERCDEMLRLLFQMKKSQPVTIANLADKLYLSIPTTKNCFNQVVQWFKSQNIILNTVRNKGICIEAHEIDYRKALRKYLLKNYENNLEEAMGQFFPGLDVVATRNLLLKIEARWRLKFSDYSFREIWVCLCLAVFRLSNGYAITTVSEKRADEVYKHKEFDFSLAIFEDVAERLKIEIPNAEVVNLAELILCANIIGDTKNGTTVDIFEYDTKLKDFVSEIIVTMSIILEEDLTDDTILYHGLLQHIRPAIFRMRYGYEKTDDMLNYAKKKYKQVYRAAWSTSPLFEEYFDVKVTDAELIYVTLYVQVALERRTRPFTAMLVTPVSNGYSQLLIMKIQKAVPRITSIQTVRQQDYRQEESKNFNVIFTTSDFPKEGHSVIRIPQMLSDETEVELKQKIRKLEEDIAKEQEQLDITCYSLIDANLTLIQSELTNKEEILKCMTDKLEEAGYVSKNYYQSVLDREKATTTAIGNGVAIPHGYAAGVNQSKVCICTLKNPILWNDEMVDVIFLLAVKMKTKQELQDIQLFYKYFIKMTDTDEKVNILRNIRSGMEMYKFMIS